jgi:peptidoglycan/LPS O-acetylase OafA/YrhL
MVADFGVLRCLAGFFAGMVLLQFYKMKSGYKLFNKDFAFMFFFLLSVFSIHFGIMDIIIIAIFPFILLTAAYNQGSVKTFFETKLLQRIGDWSFSIYMVHGPLILLLLARLVYQNPNHFISTVSGGQISISKVEKGVFNQTSFIYCLVILFVTIAISAFTYRFVELPAGRYLRKVLDANRSASVNK